MLLDFAYTMTAFSVTRYKRTADFGRFFPFFDPI